MKKSRGSFVVRGNATHAQFAALARQEQQGMTALSTPMTLACPISLVVSYTNKVLRPPTPMQRRRLYMYLLKEGGYRTEVVAQLCDLRYSAVESIYCRMRQIPYLQEVARQWQRVLEAWHRRAQKEIRDILPDLDT